MSKLVTWREFCERYSKTGMKFSNVGFDDFSVNDLAKAGAPIRIINIDGMINSLPFFIEDELERWLVDVSETGTDILTKRQEFIKAWREKYKDLT